MDGVHGKVLKLYQDFTREEVHDIFAPEVPFTPQSGTWGLQGIVAVPDRPGDYVFFVTLGQQQGEHVFDEGITEDGVLSWQSQPRQDFQSPQIKEFKGHNEATNSIHLFFRARRRANYVYLGRLKYLSHDAERSRPVYFQWQILDWNPPKEVLERMGLELQASSGGPAAASPEKNVLQQTQPPSPSKGGKSTASFKAVKVPDYSAIEAANKELGLRGEELVLRHERRVLAEAGRQDLAEKVRHVSVVEGDGAGYDIASFTPAGDPKYVEVKTTRGAAQTPFFMSANEVRFSEQHPGSYHLYRVYGYDDASKSGKYYEESGRVSERFDLEPTHFRVVRH